jgi:cytochrome P450
MNVPMCLTSVEPTNGGYPGAGAHRCIGEALARVELEESLAALAARIPQLQLDEAPAIKGHGGIRRVDTMRISWQP